MLGTTISHYKILEKLGEGGMGVVYKAQDTKLNRTVALKFLPPHISASDADKARFVQEAQAASALNHPNICTIYDVLDHEGQMFIVMEFVDGQTLKDLMASLPGAVMPLKRGLDIGIQIADGLAAAHDKGIIHRDIKPENIMVRKDGIAQIMDFGLAKLQGSKVTRLTKEGSTVGTAGYMSPEQVQGQDTDHRSDIFSLGVVLYEMLAGQLPFKGVHETALMYEIVNVDAPPPSTIRPEIDSTLDAVLLECLEKDPNERTQSAKQVSVDLKRLRRESSRQRASRISAARPVQRYDERTPMIAPQGVEKPENVRGGSLRLLFPGVAVLFLLTTVVLTFLLFQRPSPETAAIRSYILPPDKMGFANQSGTAGEGHVALSPDGTMLAFVAVDSTGKTRLMLRHLNDLTANLLPETEGASYPFWSPDNRFIGFFENGKLKKIEAAGGPPVTICDANDARGGTWSQFGTIVFSPTAEDPLYQVSAAGGKPTPLTRFDTTHHEQSHRWPHFLPDGKHVMYFARASFGGVEREEDELVVASLDDPTSKRLIPAKGNVEFSSGYLLYLRENTLMAQPFDDKNLNVTGDPLPVAEPLEYDLNYNRAVFSSSRNGLIVYQMSSTKNGWTIEWYDRGGKPSGRVGEAAQYAYAYLSPDGNTVAYDVYDPQSHNRDIWLYDLVRGIKTRFTFDPSVDEIPIWSQDSSRIFFHSDRKGHYDLYQKTTSGAGGEETLLESSQIKFPLDCSPDGKYLLYGVTDPKTKTDLWILPLTGERKPFPFLQSEFDEDEAQFSPDMRWIAYRSNESGNLELYVRPFLTPDGKITSDQTRKWQISTNGVSTLSQNRWWSQDGKNLYYQSADNRIMIADVKTSGVTLEVGAVKPLFGVGSRGNCVLLDFTKNAQRFMMLCGEGNQNSFPLALVTGWDKDLRKK